MGKVRRETERSQCLKWTVFQTLESKIDNPKETGQKTVHFQTSHSRQVPSYYTFKDRPL